MTAWSDVEREVRARLRDEATDSSGPRSTCGRWPARPRRFSPSSALAETVGRVAARLEGLGPLEPFLADPSVTEVMVNGGGSVWIERLGVLQRVEVELGEDDVLQLIERVVAPLGRHVDRLQPIVDARLPDGSRVHAVVRPLAVDGPYLTIRRFGARRIPLARAVRRLGRRVAALGGRSAGEHSGLGRCVGAGKTTLAQRAGGRDPGERTGRHGRGRRRAPAAGRARRSARSRDRPTPRASARSASAISCAARCACVPTASSWARSGAARRSTCCRR